MTAPHMGRRYQLLPQMREYDRMQNEWTPYVMFKNKRNFRSSVCNTDEHGFRYTWRDGGWLDYQGFQNYRGVKGIVCGGSTLFGVGATSDARTIPSLLNEQCETTWFNFGGRAFNSTQELLFFLFHLPNVGKVLLFSGVNNLVTHMLSTQFVLPYGAFFEDRRFYELDFGISRRDALSRLIPGRLRRLIRPGEKRGDSLDFEQRYNDSLRVVERDLEVWRLLRDSQGFSLAYVLQPFAPVCPKPLTAEEGELFAILDSYAGPQWQTMMSQLGEYYKRYVTDMEVRCRERGIRFVNCNELLPTEGWLFCDRVHLTDQANVAVAAAIKSYI